MKYSKLLNYDITSFDLSRYYKQLKAVRNWIINGCIGALAISGGVGKTLCGIIAISKMQKRDINRTALVIVPTNPLKVQWEKELNKFGIKNVTVAIINTALKIDKSYHLLILDEYHLYCSDVRIQILTKIKHTWRLGLSGSPERLDGKHELMHKYLPIIYQLDYNKGVELGYVLKVKIFNLAVPLNMSDTFKYNNLTSQLYSSMKFFKDFNTMMNCLTKRNAEIFAKENDLDSKKVQRTANFGNFAMRERKNMLTKSQSKIDEVVDILKQSGAHKTLTFGLNTDICDKLTEEFKDTSISYHSNIRVYEDVVYKKIRKTKKGALSLKHQHSGKSSKIKKVKDGYEVTWVKKKLKDKGSVLEGILIQFKDPNNNLKIINTALNLKQGVSINELSQIITYARTSSFADYDQIMWRLVRLHEGKVPIMINLYHPNTQDEKWLKNAQKNIKGEDIKWIDDYNEIKFNL